MAQALPAGTAPAKARAKVPGLRSVVSGFSDLGRWIWVEGFRVVTTVSTPQFKAKAPPGALIVGARPFQS